MKENKAAHNTSTSPQPMARRTILQRAAVGVAVVGSAGLVLKYSVPSVRAASIAYFALDEIISAPELAGSTIGFCMTQMDSGQTVYAHDDTNLFVCGSNRKLFLTAASLLKFGTQYQRETKVRASGPLTSGTLKGPIYLCGSGDPLLYDVDLSALAVQLAKSGVSHIDGPVVGDGSLFTANRRYGADAGPSDMPSSQEPGFYARQLVGQVAGLSVNRGVRSVYAAPAQKKGLPPIVSVDRGLAPFVLMNRASTTDDSTACQIYRRSGTSILVVEGTVGLMDIGSGVAAVPDAAQDAAAAFRKALIQAGVNVSGAAISGVCPPTALAYQVASHRSINLRDYVIATNKNSDALLAESLGRALGQSRSGRGDVTDGCAEERLILSAAGLDMNAVQFCDGSGMDPTTRAKPQEICNLIRYTACHPNQEIRRAFVDSFAVAGQDGTLAERMIATPAAGRVRAKTGTLLGNHCISGMFQGDSGREYVFSLAVNNTSASVSHARSLIDHMIVQLTAC